MKEWHLIENATMNTACLGLAPELPEDATAPVEPTDGPPAAPAKVPAVYTIADIAVLTTTSERHIHRLRDAGKIPGCVRLGRAVRFSKKIVDAWLAGEDS